MTVGVTIALALLFTATSAGKLTSHPTSVQMRDHHHISALRWRQLGALELAGAAGVLLGLIAPAIGIAAATGLGLVALGGLAAHLRERDPVMRAVPAVVALALASATLALQAGGA